MIRLVDITKSYGVRTLFKDVSYHFPTGERIALIGANGTGKSTLLKIIAGDEHANSGEVLIPPKVRLSHLPQEPNPRPEARVIDECVAGAKDIKALQLQMEEALAKLHTDASEANATRYADLEADFRLHDGYSIDAKAEEILVGLGFSKEMLTANPLNLSGGWRMRLELAKLFINSPDFLILDEPTNHLDLPSLVWVENYLQKFRGTLLFVSHDRELLNRLATMTLHLFQSKVQAYHGNFDQFLVARELREEQDQARRDALARRRGEMEAFVERFGAKASKASQAQSRMKMIERIKELEDEIAVEGDEKVMALRLPEPAKSGREVYDVIDGTIGYTPSKPLSKNIKLKVERQMRIAIIGANGIGKSTLLKTIAGHIAPLSGEFRSGYNVSLGFFAQDQLDTLRPQDSVIDNLLMVNHTLGQGEARSILGNFLFRGDDVFKKVSVLSGGEKSRVGLACILAKNANFLLLDEPTNHLDMSSVEILIDALCDYQGTLLFVSHDRNFIDSVCTHVFAMLPDGRSELFEGKISDYVRLARVANFPNVLEANQGLTKPVPTSSKPISERSERPKSLRSQQRSVEKRIAAAEGQMERLKLEIETVEEQIRQIPPTDFQALQDWTTDLEKLKTALHEAEEEWLLAGSLLEEMN